MKPAQTGTRSPSTSPAPKKPTGKSSRADRRAVLASTPPKVGAPRPATRMPALEAPTMLVERCMMVVKVGTCGSSLTSSRISSADGVSEFGAGGARRRIDRPVHLLRHGMNTGSDEARASRSQWWRAKRRIASRRSRRCSSQRGYFVAAVSPQLSAPPRRPACRTRRPAQTSPCRCGRRARRAGC